MKVDTKILLSVITLCDIFFVENWGGSIILWFFYGIYKLLERCQDWVK